MRKAVYLFTLCVIFFGCKTKTDKELYQSETLLIEQLSEHVYKHVSYFEAEGFGKVSCNGMVVCAGKEAIVFDTPADDGTSAELIDWITKTLGSKIIAVVPTHYHIDNLGGISEFHKQKIPSYAYQRTIQIAGEHNLPLPQHGFDPSLELKVGKEKVYVEFLGEGHTCDNVIGYFPKDNIMFGGCLIKEIGAGKGNLAEANPDAWSETVRRVKAKYPDTKIVIPGHGKHGGVELFDYTIGLFE